MPLKKTSNIMFSFNFQVGRILPSGDQQDPGQLSSSHGSDNDDDHPGGAYPATSSPCGSVDGDILNDLNMTLSSLHLELGDTRSDIDMEREIDTGPVQQPPRDNILSSPGMLDVPSPADHQNISTDDMDCGSPPQVDPMFQCSWDDADMDSSNEGKMF